MRLFQVSIAGLMGLVVLAAVVFASLHEATDLWSKGMLSLAFFVCGVALLGTILSPDARRPTWTGFLVFQAGYLALCFGPGLDEHVMPRLLTTTLLDQRYEAMRYAPSRVGETVWVARWETQIWKNYVRANVTSIPEGSPGPFQIATDHMADGKYPPDLRALSPDAFRQLGHADLSLFFGFFGAIAGRVVAGRRS